MNIIILSIFLLTVAGATIAGDLLNREPQLRIVGGVEADPNSAPYIISLIVRNRRRQFVPFCGGSLLSESWILTAAHCLIVEPSRINVAAGHHTQEDFEVTTQFRRADYFVKHEDFDRIGPYDVGLLHVSRPFQLTPQVQLVVLSSSEEYEGAATILGWGSLEPSRRRQFPSTLQVTNLTIVENSYCDEVYPIEINDGNLCAGLPDGGKSGCVGDSGGPLMQNGTQIGITSWGPVTCDVTEGPTVFTRVSRYITWIERTLEQIADNKSEEAEGDGEGEGDDNDDNDGDDDDNEEDDDDDKEDDHFEYDDIFDIRRDTTTKLIDIVKEYETTQQ